MSTNHTKIAIFDFDENLINSSTTYYFEIWNQDMKKREIIEVASTEFIKYDTLVRNSHNTVRYPDNNFLNVVQNSRDTGKNGSEIFKRDLFESLNAQMYGPCFDMFKKNIRQGVPFSINTARGHHPDTIKDAMRELVYEILDSSEINEAISNLKNTFDLTTISDKDIFQYYLDDLCKHYGVNHPDFHQKHNVGEHDNTGYKKLIAIKDYLRFIKTLFPNRTYSLGFSDDQKSTISYLHTNMPEAIEQDPLFEKVHLVLYHSSDKGVVKYKLTNKQEIVFRG